MTRAKTRLWRVQAFLLADYTGESEDVPYQPAYFYREKDADRQVQELRRSFAPGMVRIEKAVDHNEPENTEST